MGASDWSYFTPYQADIEQALQTLRQQEFEKHREFYRYTDRLASFEDFLPPDDRLSEADLREYRQEYEIYRQNHEERVKKQLPDTVDELLRWIEPDGTGSIMDIMRTSDVADDFTAAPLSREQLIEFFGTFHPSRPMLEERAHEFDHFLDTSVGRERWQATYIIVFDDDAPSEIYFCGCSGD